MFNGSLLTFCNSFPKHKLFDAIGTWLVCLSQTIKGISLSKNCRLFGRKLFFWICVSCCLSPILIIILRTLVFEFSHPASSFSNLLIFWAGVFSGLWHCMNSSLSYHIFPSQTKTLFFPGIHNVVVPVCSKFSYFYPIHKS